MAIDRVDRVLCDYTNFKILLHLNLARLKEEEEKKQPMRGLKKPNVYSIEPKYENDVKILL